MDPRHYVRMRSRFAIVASFVVASTAAASPSLEELLNEAKSCTDAAVSANASHSCDAAGEIATSAVQQCLDKWNALAIGVVGSPPADGSSDKAKAYWRSRRAYADGMEYEYVKIAELKAMNLQAMTGSCSSE